MNEAQPSSAAILSQLEKVVASAAFAGGGRSGALLRFLVERTIEGRGDELKEYTLGTEALGRGPEFDPRIDSIARVEASRLRSRLDLYYSTEGKDDAIRITLPKGSYKPSFDTAPPAARMVNYPALAAALGIAVAGITIWAIWMSRTPTTELRQLTRVEVGLGLGVSLRSSQVGSSSVIVSPDGSRLAFVSFREDGTPHLMTRRLDQAGASETIELRETEGARGPFFSPDGQWIAFLANGKLKKVQVDGGVPVALCDSPELLGGSWGKDGSIVAALTVTGLWQISSGGGREPLNGFPMDLPVRWPQQLPDGDAVLFAEGGPASQRISAFSFADHKVTPIVEGGTYGRYLASGYLAFVEQGTLFVAPFDTKNLKITGPRVAMLNDVSFSNGFDSAEFDVSENGTLVYRRDATQGRHVIGWLTPSGEPTPILNEPGVYTWLRFSPDGTKLVFTRGGGRERVLQVFDLATKRMTQLSDGRGFSSSAVWTPDGSTLVTASPDGSLHWLRADSAGGMHALLNPSNEARIPWSFNGTGDRLAYYQRGANANGSATFDLWTVPIQQTGEGLTAGAPEPYLISDAFETYPTFSQDGRWIAYTSLESGVYEIYVRAFPDDGRKWRVSSGGGRSPQWSAGKIFYEHTDRQVMVADFTTEGGAFHAKPPRLWSKTVLADTGVIPGFAMNATGKAAALFPAPHAGEPQDEQHVTLILNFLDEVRRRTR